MMEELENKIRKIEQELGERENDPRLLMELGVGKHLIGNYEEAITSFLDSLKVDPDNPSCHFNLANSYMETDRPERAIDHFLRAIELKPDHIPSLTHLADAWEQVGDSEKAEQTFRYLVQLAPDAPLCHFNLGNFLLRHNRHMEACRCYEQTLERDPTFGDAWYNIAWVLEEVGAVEKAIEFAGKGLHYSPGHEELQELVRRLETSEKAG